MIRRLLPLAGVALTTACLSTGFDQPMRPPLEVMSRTSGDPRVHTWVDEEAREVVVVSGPFHVPRAAAQDEAHGGGHGDHDDSMRSPLIPLVWPVEGGLQGFRLAAYDTSGRELPRDLMHHMIAVNFDRRQLVYPIPERLFGFGTETPDVKLPDFLEVPLEPGDSIGMYAMWHNETGRDLDGVYMKVVIPYAAPDDDAEVAMPIYMDTNNRIGGATSFDLPPGRTVKSYEFELPVAGGLLAAGGHLHDYGVELRLEDAATGEVLVDLDAERDDQGRVTGVEQKVFRSFFKLLDSRIPLAANHPYRVVGVYDNTTGRTLPDAAMAHIVGLFAPDDPSAWPELDRTTEAYARDVEALPDPPRPHQHRGGARYPR